MIYVVCGCRSQQPQEIVRLAVKSLDELQSVSAVLVSNAAFDGAELSDELASRIPFLFKQVVRDSGTYFFTFEQIDNRVFYRNDQPYMACVYLDMLLGTRIPVEPGAKRYDYFARIQEELDLMQQNPNVAFELDCRSWMVRNCVKLLPILPGSSMYGWSGRRIRFLTGRIVMYSNGIMMSRLFPRKVIMSHGKPM